jgi:hypothetical protein
MSRRFCPLARENLPSFSLHIQSSFYSTKNAVRIYYKHESFMLLLAIMIVHGDNHAKHIITLCGKVLTVLMLQQMVLRVTSRL